MTYVILNLIMASLCLIIGIAIGRKSSKYDGRFIVDDSDYETTRWTLDVDIDPKTIPDKKEIRLKVYKMTEEDV